MIFCVLEEDRLKWRGLKIDKDILEAINLASQTYISEQIKIEWAENLAARAFKNIIDFYQRKMLL